MPQSRFPKSERTEKSKPAHEVRIRNVRATIWRNVSEDGTTRYNTTFSRSYKSEEKWISTDSFGHYDLIDASKAASLAFDWVNRQSPDQNTAPADVV